MWPDPRQAFRGVVGLSLCTSRSREALDRFQLASLRALVRHAYERVPYYRRLLDRERLTPESIRTLDDLRRIPQTSRGALLDTPETERIAQGVNPQALVSHRTSGSTGCPLTIRRSLFEERLLQAYRRRVSHRMGRRLRDRGTFVGLNRHRERPLHRRLGLLRSEGVDCLQPAERILARLRAIGPDVLGGFPGTLAWIADAATDADRQAIRPRFITTAAETLTPEMRARIEQTFGARVFDQYGSHEFNLLAWECPSSGLYHVSDSSLIAEVIVDGRPAAPGEVGELVGTALHSWTMPFIRVNIGDLVTRGPERCPCGLASSLLVAINGRVADRFPLADGRSIHPYTLVRPLVAEGPWVRQYQLVQERLDRFVVRVVPLPERAPESREIARFSQVLRQHIGGEVEVEVRCVSDIPKAPSGKLRPFVPLAGPGEGVAPPASLPGQPA